MTLAQRFNIKTALEDIKEDLVNDDVLPVEEEQSLASNENIIEDYDDEIAIGVEVLEELTKLSTAIEALEEKNVAIEDYNEISKLTLTNLCSKLGVTPEHKVFPSLENISVQSLKDFSNKLSVSVESFKEKVKVLKETAVK